MNLLFRLFFYTLKHHGLPISGYDTRLSDTPLSDNRLEEGWYRFRDSNQMPTTCQGNDKCGTTIPIWMNGPHPGVNGQYTEEY